MSNKKTVKKYTYAPVKKTSSRTLAVRIFCIVLAAIMVLGMGVGLLISMMSYFVSLIDVEWIKTVLEKISFLNYYQNFTIGILSFTDVIFFLSVTALFLFFTVRALEKRRWS